jgi:predicted nucleotidyltransferase
MHSLIENSRSQIAEVCRRYGVDRLEVFGSLLREDFDDDHESDVDPCVGISR